MNGVIWQLDVLITYWRGNVHGCLCLYIVQSFPPYQKFSFHRYQCNDFPHTYTWLLEQVFVKEPVCDHLRLLNKRTAVVRNLLTYRMGDGKPNVMFVLGGPGAGKGTQCARSARFHCTEWPDQGWESSISSNNHVFLKWFLWFFSVFFGGKVVFEVKNIARIANAVQVPICLLVSTSVY